MARDILNIELELDRIVCHDEGDGWGSAEPYLWVVFFKVDGETLSVSEALTLNGNAFIQTTPGSHGNLGPGNVDAGDTITISAALGHFHTQLRPIPVPPAFHSVTEDLSGQIGAIVVLMEEDNVSDDGAEAGHQALNNAVAARINQLIAGLSFTNQDISDGDIEALSSGIEGQISGAIQQQQSFFENLWSFVNPDDQIGRAIFRFKHDDLASGGVTNFSHRWKNQGDWEIFGHITATPLCPAGALNNLFSGGMQKRSAAAAAGGEFKGEQAIETRLEREDRFGGDVFDLDALRKFRNGQFQEMRGLGHWWRLAERNIAPIVTQVIAVPGLHKPVMEWMRYLPEAVSKPDAPLDDAMLDMAEKIAETLQRKSKSRSLCRDASRVRALVPKLRGLTVGEALQMVNDINPARHPRDEDGQRVPFR